MATVLLAPAAVADLDPIISTYALPADARARVRASLEPLRDFPEIGVALGGRWDGFRFLLGPWAWMLIIYAFDEALDQVFVVTVQDARSAEAATSLR